MEIEDLPGVGKTTAEKFREAGLHDVMSIAASSPGHLVDMTGIGENVAKKVIEAARKSLNFDFISGSKLLEERKKILKLTTSVEDIDNMLGGGIESGRITEAYGPWGSGKTAIAYQLAVNATLPIEEGGLDGDVIWIDSERAFNPERIIQICEARGYDKDKVLERIKYMKVYNFDHQDLVVSDIPNKINEGVNVKLVIIDSITSSIRAELQSRSTLAVRQQKLNRHLHALMKLADIYNFCVYVTNQVMARPDTFFGDPITPVGGNVLAHAASTILYIRRGKAGTRVAKLVDSPFLEDAEATFNITEKGIEP